MIVPGRKTVFPVLVLFILLAFSCIKRDFYFEFSSFGNSGWSKEEPCVFSVPVTDTLSRYDVFLEIRNNNDYEFRNLWLFVEFSTPGGIVTRDTINCELADVYGKWYGRGISMYDLKIPYKQNLQFTHSGDYVFSIHQGMRADRLKGISAIAVQVVKSAD